MKKNILLLLRCLLLIKVIKLLNNKINKYNRLLNQYFELYGLTKKWFKNEINNISIADYFVSHKIAKIAVYGIGEMGEILIRIIEKTDIQIEYLIDQNFNLKFSKYKVVSPNNKLEVVDAVIVTPFLCYEEIKEKLSGVEMPVVSLEDIIYELENIK